MIFFKKGDRLTKEQFQGALAHWREDIEAENGGEFRDMIEELEATRDALAEHDAEIGLCADRLLQAIKEFGAVVLRKGAGIHALDCDMGDDCSCTPPRGV